MSQSGQQSATRTFHWEPMIVLTILFATGIVMDRYFEPATSYWLVAFAIASLAWLLLFLSRLGQTAAWAALLVILLCSGGLWHHVRWNLLTWDHIGLCSTDASNSSAAIQGKIISEPVVVALPPWNPKLDTVAPTQRVRFELSSHRFGSGLESKACRGCLRVFLNLPDDANPVDIITQLPACGTEIEVVGSLVPFEAPANPGEFDFGTYFRGHGRFASVYLDSTESISVLSRPDFATNLRAGVRKSIDHCLHQYVAQPHAGFASAVLLGNRDQMELETRTQFMKTGASHLLAISGLHVGILASAFLVLMRLGWVGRRKCLIATMVFVVSYAWLVEFRPTVVRASILICVMCCARLLGRKALSWTSLTTALLLVLLLNPTDLFSLGPQLSFLAISSIIIGGSWIYPPPSDDPIERLIRRTRSDPVRIANGLKREVRATFCVSFLIWTLGIPLVAARFHMVPWIAPLLNPFVLLPMAFALYFGLATIAFGWAAPWLAIPSGLLCCFFLGCIQAIVDSGAWLGVYSWVDGPGDGSLAVFYIGIFVLAAFEVTKVPARWRIAFVGAWFVFGWLVPAEVQRLQRVDSRQLEVIVIDVRHGSAALFKFPDGSNVLCDGGSLSGSNRAAETIARVMHHEGIDRLDAVIVSHADVDHFNGVPELLNRFSVGEVWMTEMMQQDDSASVGVLIEAAARSGVEIKTAGQGSAVQFSQANLKVLGPGITDGRAWNLLGDNELSMVVAVEYAGRTIMLPGDVEEFGLESLLHQKPLDVDVLLAPHHGSKNSEPVRFARWCTPEFVVASCGARKVGEREKELFQLGHRCQVLTTHEHGAVRIGIAATGEMQVEHWQSTKWVPVARVSEEN